MKFYLFAKNFWIFQETNIFLQKMIKTSLQEAKIKVLTLY